MSDDRISFDVDRVGSPVLVKASYFPNWHASGARGPWRVTPNLMVIVPTAHHVSLHYGWTGVDRLGQAGTALGLLALLWLGLPDALVWRRLATRVVPDAAITWRETLDVATRDVPDLAPV